LLEPLTVDHSLVSDVLEGYPDADDQLLARMPQHVVTRALGMEESLKVPVRTLRVVAGDVIYALLGWVDRRSSTDPDPRAHRVGK